MVKNSYLGKARGVPHFTMASSGSLLDPFCCTSYLATWAVSLRIDHRIFVFYAPVLLFAYLIVRPFKNNVINILRGPKPTSFFLGKLVFF